VVDVRWPARSVVVTGHAGKQVEVDTRPTCPHCGKVLGAYFGIPWSIRCPNCRQQATSG
jgi:DNA-directed RNA polymerase subunit RPC12/RpoP